MGCLYTTTKPTHYNSNGTRRITVGTTVTNGLVRFNQQRDSSPYITTTDEGDGNHHLNTHSPTKTSVTRSISLETSPPTPEEERRPLNVQYAEDLAPSSPLPDVITVSTIQPKKNKVTVSTIQMKTPETNTKPPDVIRSKANTTMLSNNDVTIEELDTELDQYSKYRLVYDRPLRPLSESHLQRNKTFVVKSICTRVNRPKSDYDSLTRPGL